MSRPDPWVVQMHVIGARGELSTQEVELACELDARRWVDICRSLPCVAMARAKRRLDTWPADAHGGA